MKLLYLGLDPTRFKTEKCLVHKPIIQIQKKLIDQKMKEAFYQIPKVSVVVITSRVSAELFFESCKILQIQIPKKILYISVGEATAKLLPSAISFKEECSEGVCTL